MKIILNSDGGSRGNPGNAGCGAVVSSEAGEVLKTEARGLGTMTNNEAEYWGVITAMELAKKAFGEEKRKSLQVEARMDSELVCKQLNGEYQVKEERLWPLFMKVWNLRVKDFKNITFKYVPREQNGRADELANEAMDKAAGVGGLFS